MTPQEIAPEDLECVRQVFPEIDLLEDREIAGKVTRIWAKAWRKSNWKRIEDACFSPYLAGPTLVGHVRFTVHAGLSFADILEEIQGIKVDKQRLVLLALLHDVSKLLEYEKTRKSEMGELLQHGFYGAHLALEEGFSWEIVHEILTHTPQSKMRPRFIEGVLLAHIDYGDADALHIANGKSDNLLL